DEPPASPTDGATRETRPSPTRAAPDPPIASAAPAETLTDPLIISQSRSGAERGALTDALRNGDRRTPATTDTTPRGGGVSSARDLVAGLRERAIDEWRSWDLSELPAAQPSRGAPGPAATPRRTPAGERPNATTRPTPRQSNAASNPSDTLRVVKPDESLYKICKATYGDGNLWRQLAAYNHDRVGKNGAVRAGVTLRMPELEVLRASNDRSAAPSPTTERAAPQRVPDAPASSDRTYVVQKGDTLGAIARAELGATGRWREIAELNELKNPNVVVVGSTLRLPAR
ncbi:MAG: LysM peptidoglycan-binding domain-containing protein, partial [Planctomycetota bacterium]